MPGVGAGPAREATGSNLYRWLRGRFYRWRGPTFGLRDALLWSTALDTWHRYAALMEGLEKRLDSESRILEVGPGWFGLEFFLPPAHLEAGRLVQVDILSRPLLRLRTEGAKLVGSGATLPVGDDAFDFVVAMDVLEHVPKNARPAFARELQRVARRGGFLHMPLESEDGTYQAARSDEAFQRWFEQHYGRPEPNIEEHLASGHPTVEDLRIYFPHVSLRPTQSVEDWLWYMTRERTVSGRLFTGLIRYLRGVRSGPPYYSALAAWEAG